MTLLDCIWSCMTYMPGESLLGPFRTLLLRPLWASETWLSQRYWLLSVVALFTALLTTVCGWSVHSAIDYCLLLFCSQRYWLLSVVALFTATRGLHQLSRTVLRQTLTSPSDSVLCLMGTCACMCAIGVNWNWCGKNYLCLSVSKTKEMCIDLREIKDVPNKSTLRRNSGEGRNI